MASCLTYTFCVDQINYIATMKINAGIFKDETSSGEDDGVLKNPVQRKKGKVDTRWDDVCRSASMKKSLSQKKSFQKVKI